MKVYLLHALDFRPQASITTARKEDSFDEADEPTLPEVHGYDDSLSSSFPSLMTTYYCC